MEVLLSSKSLLWPNGSPLVYSTKYKGKLCLFEETVSTTRVRSWLLQIRPCSCWKSQVALSLLKGDIQPPSVVRNTECLSPASLPDPSARPCLSDPTSQSRKPSRFPEHTVPGPWSISNPAPPAILGLGCFTQINAQLTLVI